MPFGLKNVGATYQRLMDQTFSGQLGRNIDIYVDDMVIKNRSEGCFISDILETFEMLIRTNMNLNLNKCTFGVESGQFLGYMITNEGIKANPEKVQAIIDLASPKSLRGCINKKDFKWSTKAEASFQELKSHLKSLSALTTPKPEETLTLYLAAANETINAVLFTDRGESPRTTEQVETEVVNEGLGQPMLPMWTLFTDGASSAEGSGARLILTDPNGQEVTYALRFDFKTSNNEAEYEALIACLELAIQMEVQHLQVFSPEEEEYVLKEAHFGSCGAHARARTIAQKATRLRYYWPTMYHDASKFVETCQACQQHAPTIRQPQYELTSISSPWPFYQWGIDIVGPFLEAPGQVKFLFVAIDYFTKWVKAKPPATITGQKILRFVCRNIVCRFGIPGIIISDNEKQFANNPFKEWCEELKISQHFTSVTHPQANGQTEVTNRTILQGLKTRLGKAKGNWVDELPNVL
ncbi:reverse transcriptase domain-containing protein [Tanacetum coccineum]